MQFNCKIKNLEKINISGESYFSCKKKGGCVHGGREEIGGEGVCGLNPYWRVAVKYSREPIRFESDVDRFYEVIKSRHPEEFVDIVLGESWKNIYVLYDELIGKKYSKKSE